MSRAVIEVTAGPVVGPSRGKTIVVLATPLSPQDVHVRLHMFTRKSSPKCEVSSSIHGENVAPCPPK